MNFVTTDNVECLMEQTFEKILKTTSTDHAVLDKNITIIMFEMPQLRIFYDFTRSLKIMSIEEENQVRNSTLTVLAVLTKQL